MTNSCATIVPDLNLKIVKNVLGATLWIDLLINVDLVKTVVQFVPLLRLVMCVKRVLSNLFKRIVNSEIFE